MNKRQMVEPYLPMLESGEVTARVVANKLSHKGVSLDNVKDALKAHREKKKRPVVVEPYPEISVEEKTEIQILQSSLSESLKREKQALSYAASIKEQMDALESAIPKLPPLVHTPKWKGHKEWADADAVLMIGDWHGHEVVNYNEMRGANEYNYDILCNRAWMLTEKAKMIVDKERKAMKISTLHASILGDMVTGDIHDELLATNEGTALQAVLAVGTILAQVLGSLAQEFDKVVATGVVGNHGRTTKKPTYKRRVADNLDSMVYWFAKTQLANLINSGRIEFDVPESIDTVVERRGWATLIEHGDENRGNAGLPYYSIDRTDTKIRQMNRRTMGDPEFDSAPHHIREMGHFHQYGILEGPTLLNMALIGPNEFSKNKLKKACPPGQIMYFLNDKHGIINWSPIWVKDAESHGWHTNPELVYHAQEIIAA